MRSTPNKATAARGPSLTAANAERMRDVATEVEASNPEHPNDVTVKVVRVAAPPIAMSEANCAQNGLGTADEWLAFLRRWKIVYRKNGALHIALTADVETAIRAGATSSKPGPKAGTMPKTPLPKKDASVTELLERSGFRRAQ